MWMQLAALPLGQIDGLSIGLGVLGGVVVGIAVAALVMKNMASSALKRSKKPATQDKVNA